jgi:hypothetical protein
LCFSVDVFLLMLFPLPCIPREKIDARLLELATGAAAVTTAIPDTDHGSELEITSCLSSNVAVNCSPVGGGQEAAASAYVNPKTRVGWGFWQS